MRPARVAHNATSEFLSGVVGMEGELQSRLSHCFCSKFLKALPMPIHACVITVFIPRLTHQFQQRQQPCHEVCHNVPPCFVEAKLPVVETMELAFARTPVDTGPLEACTAAL